MSDDLLAPGALLARTPAGNNELNRPAKSLSVPQRRLLLMIQKGIDYRTLMDGGSSVDRERKGRDLALLIELGLVVQVDADGRTLRTQSAGPRTRLGADTVLGPSTAPGPSTAFGPATALGPFTDAGPETTAGHATMAGHATGFGYAARKLPALTVTPPFAPNKVPGKKPLALVAILAVVGLVLLVCLVWWALRDGSGLREATVPTPAAASNSGKAAP